MRRTVLSALRKPPLLPAIAVSLVTLPAFAGEVTVEELARRLQALEQRLGSEAETASPASTGLADLDQRLRVLERKLELQAEETARQAANTPVVSLSATKGFSVRSAPPGDIEVKLKGLFQADGRFFIDDEQNPQSDTFLWRRVRPTLEGSWGPLIGFRLTPEFAGDNATIVDAYVDVKFDPRATLRAGKVKGPVGLERLQSGGAIALVERGFPTELAPNRELGVQLQGEFLGSALNYMLGVYNGAPDGRDAPTTNPDNEFEYAARVFWEPFKNDANAWSGLGFGIAASVGDKFGQGDNFLPRYRTPGQVRFFAYRSDAAADGLHRRWSPQGYYYRGPFGLLAEYITSEQEVALVAGTNAGRRTHIENDAYSVTASWVLTGEDAGYKGVARPNHPFTTGAAGWGALELVARVGGLDVDDEAFPLFANPATAARNAEAWSLGVNWYLTSNLKLVANYTQTQFEGGAQGGDREDEKAFFTRAQVSF